jgi:type IV pilus assembly protein PilQ
MFLCFGFSNAGEPGAPQESSLVEKLAPSITVADNESSAAADAPADAAQDNSGGPAAQPDEPREQIVKISADDRVTMHVVGLPLADAMRLLSEPTKRNIVLAEGVVGNVTASFYDVSFEEALKAMLTSNKLAFRQQGEFVYVYSQEDMDKLIESERKVVSKVFQLTYMNAASIKSLIEPMLSKVGKISVTPPSSRGLGGDQGPSDTEGDSVATPDTLIVTDYEDRVQHIAEVLLKLDAKPRQVLIEATILRATLDEDNALGIDFTTVGGVDFSTLSSVSPGAQSIATGNIPTPELNNTNFTVRTDFNAALPAGGFTFGILKDQVGVFIRALEQITDTNIIANPKILALNKQVGQVIVGRRDGYLTTTITETTAVQTVEFLETGTVLTFRPYIGEDGVVRMEIHPKDSTGGLTDANLPFEQTTEVTTNILVKDGNTVLIGGLFREVSTGANGQVPLLGNIPGVGALFRRTRDATVREEVIVLLTVHIIKGDDDSAAGEELKQDVERMRVGMRRGIQWFGRERLGEAHYRWALEHLARGDTCKALWDTELALNNFPRHVPAEKLKEKLLNKRSWEAEGSIAREYVRDRIAEETGVKSTPFGRPSDVPPVPDGLEGPTGVEEDDEAAEKSSMTETPISGDAESGVKQ